MYEFEHDLIKDTSMNVQLSIFYELLTLRRYDHNTTLVIHNVAKKNYHLLFYMIILY